MSSHREAPEISKDPVADSTDLYAFVSPDAPDTVTFIANYIPMEAPDGGPNFYEFGTDVLYYLYIDNDGDALPEITYAFQFQDQLANPHSFLYNTGPITSLDSPNWNKRQTFTVTRYDGSSSTMLGTGLATPPCNIGPLSTPNYSALAQAAVHSLPSGEMVFAGQRLDPFFVDLGAVFDLGDLRPFQQLHVNPIASTAGTGVDSLKYLNVHTIAIRVPINQLTSNGTKPSGVTDSHATIGVWTAANRQVIRILEPGGSQQVGPYTQVSRLGNPLINEAVIPLGYKDLWNSQPPIDDANFIHYYQHPELASLLPVLYPGVFPNLAGLNAARADLVAILLTGIPGGIIPGFQNVTGTTPADMLRLNMAVPPSANPNPLGILGSDLAGFPNGRRLMDDVFTIELRAIAGVTYALIDSTFKPDAAAALVTDGLTPDSGRFMSSFPYVGVPWDGYSIPAA